jgi:outer membrane lipoprotein LolB
MRALRAGVQVCLLAALGLLSGCASQASLQSAAANSESHWQGRLAVKVYSKPVQAFSASFDLQGRPAKGALVLTSPMGTTLASMQWDAQSATLTANGKQQSFDSLQELALQATGADIPVASLFAWLDGRAEAVPGWQVDLSELPAGRLQAHHTEEVQSELKIILDR